MNSLAPIKAVAHIAAMVQVNDPKNLGTIDRGTWAIGPWDEEADDLANWTDAETGLNCGIGRARPGGYWCGYVVVVRSHPLHGKAVEDCIADPCPCAARGEGCFDRTLDSSIEIHGGVAFAGAFGPFWAIGFACGTDDDIRPGETLEFRKARQRYPFGLMAEYRTESYARAECARLARQVKALEGGSVGR